MVSIRATGRMFGRERCCAIAARLRGKNPKVTRGGRPMDSAGSCVVPMEGGPVLNDSIAFLAQAAAAPPQMAQGVSPTAIVQAVATAIAACAALASFLAVWMVKRQTQSQILLGCLQAYVEVRKQRQEALELSSELACFEYYRALFDLHWTEFRLWRSGQIPKRAMSAWLDARHRNFQHDSIGFTDESGNKQYITYQDVWNRLVQQMYFAPSDNFITFMTLVHDGQIEKAMKVKA